MQRDVGGLLRCGNYCNRYMTAGANAIRSVKDIYSQTVFSQEGEELYLREKIRNIC